MTRDNHTGPKFDEVRKLFPDAVRFHWHQNAFKKDDSYWMVGVQIATGGGQGIKWIEHRM